MAGIALAAAKIIVGIAANSTAVVSDGFETTADVLTSGIVFAGLWLASRPPDENHPYGHGRYETLAGLAVGATLLITGAAICSHSFVSMSEPGQVAAFALYPLFAAVIVKVSLAALKFRFGRLISSTALTADAWHDVTDLLSTTVALVAVGLSVWDPEKFHKADHLGGILIGLIVIFVGLRLMRNTADQLTDIMPDEGLLEQIRAVALDVPGAAGIEKCFARRTGFQYHVDLHLEVNSDMTVRQSHEIATQVKERIKKELDWVANVLVHVEPAPEPVQESARKRRTRSGGT
jgi:cation diffusion facilitator family transporter